VLYFDELDNLSFHHGFEIVEARRSRVKFAARFFTILYWPFMWPFSWVAVICAEKDPRQRSYNWQILGYLFDPALLLSDNIIVKAKRLNAGENRTGA
jgi:hypothetical protein